jgi:hypothetical protein
MSARASRRSADDVSGRIAPALALVLMLFAHVGNACRNSRAWLWTPTRGFFIHAAQRITTDRLHDHVLRRAKGSGALNRGPRSLPVPSGFNTQKGRE